MYFILFSKEKVIFVHNVVISMPKEANCGEVKLHVQKMINAQETVQNGDQMGVFSNTLFKSQLLMGNLR